MKVIATVLALLVILDTTNGVRKNHQEEFNWCSGSDSILCLGDSFTWGPVGKKYPTALAELMQKPPETVMNAGWGGQTSNEILQRYLHTDLPRTWNLIVWAGRNNAWENERIIADIDSMIAGKAKYLVLEILNGNFKTEQRGSPYFENLKTLNLALAKKHGKHFVWLKEYLASCANGSFSDYLLVANGGVPQSLIVQGDSLHLNGFGNFHVAEKIIMQLDPCSNTEEKGNTR